MARDAPSSSSTAQRSPTRYADATFQLGALNGDATYLLGEDSYDNFLDGIDDEVSFAVPRYSGRFPPHSAATNPPLSALASPVQSSLKRVSTPAAQKSLTRASYATPRPVHPLSRQVDESEHSISLSSSSGGPIGPVGLALKPLPSTSAPSSGKENEPDNTDVQHNIAAVEPAQQPTLPKHSRIPSASHIPRPPTTSGAAADRLAKAFSAFDTLEKTRIPLPKSGSTLRSAIPKPASSISSLPARSALPRPTQRQGTMGPPPPITTRNELPTQAAAVSLNTSADSQEAETEAHDSFYENRRASVRFAGDAIRPASVNSFLHDGSAVEEDSLAHIHRFVNTPRAFDPSASSRSGFLVRESLPADRSSVSTHLDASVRRSFHVEAVESVPNTAPTDDPSDSDEEIVEAAPSSPPEPAPTSIPSSPPHSHSITPRASAAKRRSSVRRVPDWVHVEEDAEASAPVMADSPALARSTRSRASSLTSTPSFRERQPEPEPEHTSEADEQPAPPSPAPSTSDRTISPFIDPRPERGGVSFASWAQVDEPDEGPQYPSHQASPEIDEPVFPPNVYPLSNTLSTSASSGRLERRPTTLGPMPSSDESFDRTEMMTPNPPRQSSSFISQPRQSMVNRAGFDAGGDEHLASAASPMVQQRRVSILQGTPASTSFSARMSYGAAPSVAIEPPSEPRTRRSNMVVTASEEAHDPEEPVYEEDEVADQDEVDELPVEAAHTDFVPPSPPSRVAEPSVHEEPNEGQQEEDEEEEIRVPPPPVSVIEEAPAPLTRKQLLARRHTQAHAHVPHPPPRAAEASGHRRIASSSSAARRPGPASTAGVPFQRPQRAIAPVRGRNPPSGRVHRPPVHSPAAPQSREPADDDVEMEMDAGSNQPAPARISDQYSAFNLWDQLPMRVSPGGEEDGDSEREEDEDHELEPEVHVASGAELEVHDSSRPLEHHLAVAQSELSAALNSRVPRRSLMQQEAMEPELRSEPRASVHRSDVSLRVELQARPADEVEAVDDEMDAGSLQLQTPRRSSGVGVRPPASSNPAAAFIDTYLTSAPSPPPQRRRSGLNERDRGDPSPLLNATMDVDGPMSQPSSFPEHHDQPSPVSEDCSHWDSEPRLEASTSGLIRRRKSIRAMLQARDSALSGYDNHAVHIPEAAGMVEDAPLPSQLFEHIVDYDTQDVSSPQGPTEELPASYTSHQEPSADIREPYLSLQHDDPMTVEDELEHYQLSEPPPESVRPKQPDARSQAPAVAQSSKSVARPAKPAKEKGAETQSSAGRKVAPIPTRTKPRADDKTSVSQRREPPHPAPSKPPPVPPQARNRKPSGVTKPPVSLAGSTTSSAAAKPRVPSHSQPRSAVASRLPTDPPAKATLQPSRAPRVDPSHQPTAPSLPSERQTRQRAHPPPPPVPTRKVSKPLHPPPPAVAARKRPEAPQRPAEQTSVPPPRAATPPVVIPAPVQASFYEAPSPEPAVPSQLESIPVTSSRKRVAVLSPERPRHPSSSKRSRPSPVAAEAIIFPTFESEPPISPTARPPLPLATEQRDDSAGDDDDEHLTSRPATHAQARERRLANPEPALPMVPLHVPERRGFESSTSRKRRSLEGDDSSRKRPRVEGGKAPRRVVSHSVMMREVRPRPAAPPRAPVHRPVVHPVAGPVPGEASRLRALEREQRIRERMEREHEQHGESVSGPPRVEVSAFFSPYGAIIANADDIFLPNDLQRPRVPSGVRRPPVTVPTSAFTFATDARAAQHREQFEARLTHWEIRTQEAIRQAKESQMPRKPLPDFTAMQIQHNERILAARQAAKQNVTAPKTPALRTKTRVRQRHEFDERVRERDRLMRELRAAEAAVEEERDRLRVKELRKQLDEKAKAHPVPMWYRVQEDDDEVMILETR